jgi:hypothetical protein
MPTGNSTLSLFIDYINLTPLTTALLSCPFCLFVSTSFLSIFFLSLL